MASNNSENKKAYNREYYLKTRDACIRRAKEYRLRHPGRNASQRKASIKRNPESYILSTTKHRAKKAGIPFDLTISDIKIPDYCPYLGIKLLGKGNGRGLANTASIDKIDPNKGYTKGNIMIISFLANQMKSCASRSQLLNFAQSVIRLHGYEV